MAYFIFLESRLCCSWWCYLSIMTQVYPFFTWEWGRDCSCSFLFLFAQKEVGPLQESVKWDIAKEGSVDFTLLSSKSHPKPKHNFLIGFNPSNKRSFATSVHTSCTQFDSFREVYWYISKQTFNICKLAPWHGCFTFLNRGVHIFIHLGFSVSLANCRIVLLMMFSQIAVCEKNASENEQFDKKKAYIEPFVQHKEIVIVHINLLTM